MELRESAPGVAATVLRVGLAPDDRVRLGELGLREGTVLHVVNRGAFGARVVALGSDRLALDGATCERIEVEAS